MKKYRLPSARSVLIGTTIWACLAAGGAATQGAWWRVGLWVAVAVLVGLRVRFWGRGPRLRVGADTAHRLALFGSVMLIIAFAADAAAGRWPSAGLWLSILLIGNGWFWLVRQR